MLRNLGKLLGMGGGVRVNAASEVGSGSPGVVRVGSGDESASAADPGSVVSVGIDQLVLTVQATMMPTYTPTLEPTMMPTFTPTLTPTPEPTLQPTVTPLVPLNQGYGMQAVKCVGCAVYEVLVRLTNYWPDNPATEEEIERGRELQKFGNDDLITTQNCWKYSISQGACVSAMETELPWRSFVGWAAACPYDWPDGAVLHVPALGRSFWCLDRGTMVCAGGVCDVDILSPDLPQNGTVFNAVLEVSGW